LFQHEGISLGASETIRINHFAVISLAETGDGTVPTLLAL
jgi:hypothetical protein